MTAEQHKDAAQKHLSISTAAIWKYYGTNDSRYYGLYIEEKELAKKHWRIAKAMETRQNNRIMKGATK